MFGRLLRKVGSFRTVKEEKQPELENDFTIAAGETIGLSEEARLLFAECEPAAPKMHHRFTIYSTKGLYLSNQKLIGRFGERIVFQSLAELKYTVLALLRQNRDGLVYSNYTRVEHTHLVRHNGVVWRVSVINALYNRTYVIFASDDSAKATNYADSELIFLE